jgi:DNA ligase D-like protein (predicted 3'-phosphoesterase)
MAKTDPLQPYRAKRNFGRTLEPRGRRPPPLKLLRAGHKPSRKPVFVVQKHAARALHYDFRLEVDGVLKSWAVPKGPSTNPKDKRLAMPTEDHPLEYATFEGVIPEGEYGAGRIIVWDTGAYRNVADHDGKAVSMEQAVRNGRVRVWLEGKKLRRGFALTRIGKGKTSRWLLVKKEDEEADAKTDLLRRAPESVQSGRTIEEMAAERPKRTRKRDVAA